MGLKFIVKYILFLFNLIFVILGVAIIAIGAIVKLQLDEIRKSVPDQINNIINQITLIPIIVIVIGCIIFVIAFQGCCGAIRESKCLLITYACIMFILAIIKIYIVVMIFKNMSIYQKEVENFVGDVFVNKSNEFHAIEHTLKCCGTNGAGSYDGILEHLPPTCCKGVYEACSSEGEINVENWQKCLCKEEDAYEIGCTNLIGDFFGNISKYFGYGFITTIAIEILTLVSAAYLVTSIGKHWA